MPLCAIGPVHLGAGLNLAGEGAQAKGAALFDACILVGKEVNDLVFGDLVKFPGVGVLHAADVAGQTP